MIDAINEGIYRDDWHNHIRGFLSEIDEFKGGWPSLNTLSPQRLEILKKSAIIDSISSSTRIEGIKLQDHQIDNLLNNIHQISFKDSSEDEIRFLQLAEHLRTKVLSKISIVDNRIFEKEISPKGKEYWYARAKRTLKVVRNGR